MADRFYSVIKGEQNPAQVTEGSSTSGEEIELRIADTIWANKIDALLCLEAIKNYLISKENSPIG